MAGKQQRSMNSGGQNPEFILRDFEGMNVIAAREAINDNEFAWCENAIPVAAGSLYPTNAASAALVTVTAETGPPSYATNFSTGGANLCFAVWSGSGNGYIIDLATNVATKIITGLTSGQTFAIQYNSLGLLIIDPAGYWDWNLTTPSTLTPQNNTVSGFTQVAISSTAGGTSLKQIVIAAAGATGGEFQTDYQVTSVTINGAGSGYSVGDTLLLTDGNPTTPASIVVATIGGSGAIATVDLSSGGSYPGPTSGTLVATGPSGNTVTGGSAGTGATFNVQIQATGVTVLKPGTGYNTGDELRDEVSGGTTIDEFSINSSGVIGGTSIATYAGRVWIGTGRVVLFTDINSYNSFGGAGGSFTIQDAYLDDAITALFSANNYLYIFGPTSIDALSNVTISGGVTAFSRINIVTAIGTSEPTSIFAYYRAIVFAHASGFYLLAGASPEKISEKITPIVFAIDPNISVYGAPVIIQGELCATMLFNFFDSFTQDGTERCLFALYFRGRWWVASIGTLNAKAMISVPVAGVATLYAWAGNQLYQMFSSQATLANWLLKTKLWDGGAPLHEKQSINVGLAGVLEGQSSSGVTVTIDTELSSSSPITMTNQSLPPGYQLNVQLANNAAQTGAQYLGLTIAGNSNVSRVNLIALRGKADRDLMQ